MKCIWALRNPVSLLVAGGTGLVFAVGTYNHYAEGLPDPKDALMLERETARLWAQGYRAAGKLRFRSGLAYAPGHTWVRDEGSSLKVGLDDLAQKILPWTVAVELPSPGQVVKAGEPFPTDHLCAPAHEGCRCMLQRVPR